MEKNLGHATAYGYAKSKGYTGTEEEFGVLMASYASVAQDASQSASSAAESAQLASNEAQSASQSATSAHNDVETASNIKADVESARDTAVSAKNTTVEAKNISVEAKNSAISAKDTAESKAQIAEAWAVGQKDGTDVPSTDETYHNNAKYYSEQADIAKTDAESAQQLAQASATSASESASDASASAQMASQAAQTATDKASEASQSASTATTKASEASQSATNASQSAVTATSKASEATTAATTATTKASEASQSATGANTAKINAEIARDAAAQSASEAANSAIEAAQSAQSVNAERLNRIAFGSYVVKESTGSIAHFEDGADNIPMKDVLVHIEPVQEGSGDPSPENVRPITGWTRAKVTRCGKNLLPTMLESFTRNGLTCTKQSDGTYVINGTATAETYFSFASPTNTAINVSIPRNTPLVLSGCPANGASNTYRIVAYLYKGNTFLDAAISDYGNRATIDRNDIDGLRISANIKADVTCENLVFKPMLQPASDTDFTYEPYSGQTYDITFPTEAGTVYGGTLDVTNGELVVDRGFKVFNGSENWAFSSISIRPNIKITDIAYRGVVICNMYPYSSEASAIEGTISTNGGDGYTIWIKDSINGDSLVNWKTFLATNNLQVVYELAAPITYHLSEQEITSLLGTNNLWADTGDSDVEYRANTKLYIDNLTRSTEDDMTANVNISKDAYFTIGNTLYKASVAISAGETIVPNTNCTIVSLADALNTLATSIGGN